MFSTFTYFRGEIKYFIAFTELIYNLMKNLMYTFKKKHGIKIYINIYTFNDIVYI